jgi:hypothetical protein
MSYYDHATMIAHQLGPWQQRPEPPFDVPARYRKARHHNRMLRPAAAGTLLPNTSTRQAVSNRPVIRAACEVWSCESAPCFPANALPL